MRPKSEYGAYGIRLICETDTFKGFVFRELNSGEINSMDKLLKKSKQLMLKYPERRSVVKHYTNQYLDWLYFAPNSNVTVFGGKIQMFETEQHELSLSGEPLPKHIIHNFSHETVGNYQFLNNK